ncbi:hypothetical protein HID58_096301 [Brassica napus]|uniref:Copine C-terminal domain-containing protein n=1 Tax=Brassica napus TaxID=3708 RepID=A0ABQ7X174_BRANA|nr:hypothetical protein HID58_096301 [Brassica napus]
MTANKRLRSECEEFISPYSSYALSIALIGVGDGRWEDMRKFDDKIPKREFDNFKVVREEEKEVLLLDNDSGGSYTMEIMLLSMKGELLWTPSLPQKLRIGIVLSKGQLPGGHTVVHGPFVFLMLYQRHALRGTLKKHLITASYVDDETSMLHEMAKNASITVLGETTSHNSVNLTWPLV